MFERILLPLDGSQLAEAAIPYGEELAGRLGAELILFHACAPQHKSFSHMHSIYLQSMAENVLRQTRRRFAKCEGYCVRAETAIGEPADAIFHYAQQNNINLVVMATHGASGFQAWMLGSTADKVIRAVNLPTLLIRVKQGGPVEGKKRLICRILLPLDGSDASEIAVPYALELAKWLKASISLFEMVPKVHVPADFTSTDWAKVEAAQERQTRAHLIKLEERLRQEGVPVTHAVTIGTDAAAEILEQEKKTAADLVVMATRGRSPIARWALGSVAEKVLRQGDLPLLLVREAL